MEGMTGQPSTLVTLLGLGLGVGFMIFNVLVFAFQVVCAVHVFKRGRDYWWLFLIFFFPLIGSVVYFFVEMLPDLRSGRRVGGVSIPGGGRRRIRQLEAAMLYSDTYANRKDLADAYLAGGVWEKAVPAYEYCLANGGEDDQELKLALALALFQMERHDEADETLAKIPDEAMKNVVLERDMLHARVLEARGRDAEALTAYEDLVRRWSGEEARCRLGLFLQKTGEVDRSKRIFEEIVTRSKHSPAFYSRAQREWIKVARKNR